ncbi:hypothetical protein COT52_00070 [candidate division WWE3 bacterium CG08_land_8_20_14_0_20_43_13]|uniref:Uncharacterized protein n=1 Tax=candidate division WWE3 bacterium CG08_land_8_20_14_0_20_43_13 TaxID=1975087 RepID=A0A2H0X8A0_UNCKA|nr:MAG: hypothetical protein COT52_00070 [candidate division WWE3 bacterium CG08_land_8_20_14_0_20_43_13]
MNTSKIELVFITRKEAVQALESALKRVREGQSTVIIEGTFTLVEEGTYQTPRTRPSGWSANIQ